MNTYAFIWRPKGPLKIDYNFNFLFFRNVARTWTMRNSQFFMGRSLRFIIQPCCASVLYLYIMWFVMGSNGLRDKNKFKSEVNFLKISVCLLTKFSCKTFLLLKVSLILRLLPLWNGRRYYWMTLLVTFDQLLKSNKHWNHEIQCVW